MSDSPRVLIIEDDAEAAQLTARRLSSADIDSTTCLGASGSVNVFANGSFDVVILDVDMPGLEGTKLIKALWERAQDRRPQILLYSNYDASALEDAARRYGANAWLEKSADKATFVSTVKRLLAAPPPSRI